MKADSVVTAAKKGIGKSVIAKILFGVAIVLVIAWVLVGLSIGNVFAGPKEGTCAPLPQNGRYLPVKRGIYTVEGQDTKVFVLRGIAERSGPSNTDSEDLLPPCYTNEEGMYTDGGLILIAEGGERLFLIKGVVGSADGSAVEATPFP